MSTTSERIRHLLGEELGACCEADVEARINELEGLAIEAFEDDACQAVFAVLGDTTRYRLLRVLVASESERCVCELEGLVDVSDSAVSHALSDLVEAGLAERRKSGTWRYYTDTPLATALFETAEAFRSQ